MATVCTLLWRRFMSEAAPRGAKRAAPAPPPARANAWRERPEPRTAPTRSPRHRPRQAPRAPWPKSLVADDDLVGAARRSSRLQE